MKRHPVSRYTPDCVTPPRAGQTLEREEQLYEAKLAALRAAIDEGDASGIAKGNAFDRARKTLKLRTKPR
jgi:hypothetical protein